MIFLDTNVISELMRSEPDPNVEDWLAKQTTGHIATTTICVAEILRGIKRLPAGRRRNGLNVNFLKFLSAFSGRIHSFDLSAAEIFSEIAAIRESHGNASDPIDLMIASIAIAQGGSLATRNLRDFKHCGVHLINPWEID